MTNHVIAAALNESLFGSLPEAVLRDLELTSRITRVPSGKLVYNPEGAGAVESAANSSQARAQEADKWADISRSADFPDGE